MRPPRENRVQEPRDINTAKIGGVYEITHYIIEELNRYGHDEFDRARSLVSTWIARREASYDADGKMTHKGGNGFPEPVAKIKVAALYDMDEVIAWIDATQGAYGAK